MREAEDPGESAPVMGHRSGRGGRVEVVTRAERRRRWTPEQKRQIVTESLEGSSTPSEVARRHGIGTGLLYTWRRQFLEGELGARPAAGPGFARVEVMALPASEAGLCEAPAEETRGAIAGGSRMEIVLSGGDVVRVDATVEEAALRRVLSALGAR